MEALLKTINEIGSEELAAIANDCVIDGLNNSLTNAAISGDIKKFEVLMKLTFVDPSFHGSIALQRAAEMGHAGIVEILLKDPRTCNLWFAATRAAGHGNIEVAERLVSDPRVVITKEEFQDQINYQRESFIKVLMKSGKVDPSANGNRALYLAIRRGDESIIKLLLEDARVDPSADGCRPIFQAIELRVPQIAKMMVAAPQFDLAKHANVLLSSEKIREDIKQDIRKRLPSPAPTVNFTIGSSSITIDYDARKYSVQQM